MLVYVSKEIWAPWQEKSVCTHLSLCVHTYEYEKYMYMFTILYLIYTSIIKQFFQQFIECQLYFSLYDTF